jgi:glycerol uptake facilitator protein
MKFTPAQEFAAEFLGTMVLILFGVGSVAMVVLFGHNPPIPGEVVKGGYTNIVLGWGLAVTFGIYIAGTVSGAHLNPAVTLSLAATKRFSWTKVPHYLAAQFLGAFAGAGLVFADFHAQWKVADPALDHTTGVFCTFPAQPGFWPGFLDQVIGTALLVGLIFAVVDKLNAQPGANLAPFIIGLLVVAIGISFGGMNGYAINPARDFGPRLFAVFAGFTHNGLTDGVPGSPDSPLAIWTIPILGPIVGGLIGGFTYDFFIGRALIKAHELKASDRTPGEDPSYRERAVTPAEEHHNGHN